MEWKTAFKERYKELTDWEKFSEYSLKPLRKAIRVNTLKTTTTKIKKQLPNLKPIPWCKEGFYIDGLSLGNTKQHFLGHIYIQGASSMIPPVVLKPKPDEIILDVAAAPGSKTSQIAAMMKNTGIIVANDPHIVRLKPLTINLQRCGVTNTLLTRMDGRWFKEMKFDKILLDAPCSGVGTSRKSPKIIYQWSPGFVKKMSHLQKQLITTAFNALKENGTMVYSTCTLEPEEDEEVIDFLLKKFDNAKIEKINLDIKSGKPVQEFENKIYSSEIKKTLRLWPQLNDTEGFFIAKIKKV